VTDKYRPPRANWLASYPKSGNTWVRLFIHAYVTGGCHINWNTTTTLSDSMLDYYNVVARYPIVNTQPETIFFYRHAVLLHMLIASPVSPRIIKTHTINGNFGGVTLIPEPMTRSAVYLVRDPRDVALSFARHVSKEVDQMITDMDTEAFMLHSATNPVPVWIGRWHDHVESWTQKEYTTVVRYEDLKDDPETHFARILEAFHMKINRQRLRKAIRLCDIERLKKQESQERFSELGSQDKFFGQGRGWANELTEKQAMRIVANHSDQMTRHGYGLSNTEQRADDRPTGPRLLVNDQR